jgi:hypothetical protein
MAAYNTAAEVLGITSTDESLCLLAGDGAYADENVVGSGTGIGGQSSTPGEMTTRGGNNCKAG